jgi:hypothetical protein|tara:strand:- start:9816 stop:10058 length:243 start_codon:yes stop_codon:yes gene_type:complete
MPGAGDLRAQNDFHTVHVLEPHIPVRRFGKYFPFTTFRRLIAHTRLTFLFLQSGDSRDVVLPVGPEFAGGEFGKGISPLP